MDKVRFETSGSLGILTLANPLHDQHPRRDTLSTRLNGILKPSLATEEYSNAVHDPVHPSSR
jgi:hypothetical protein